MLQQEEMLYLRQRQIQRQKIKKFSKGFSKYASEADVAFPSNQNRSSSVEVQLLHMLDLSCNCCTSWIWADALADTFIAADAKGGGGGKIKHETTEQEKANTYILLYLLPFFENIPLILNELFCPSSAVSMLLLTNMICMSACVQHKHTQHIVLCVFVFFLRVVVFVCVCACVCLSLCWPKQQIAALVKNGRPRWWARKWPTPVLRNFLCGPMRTIDDDYDHHHLPVWSHLVTSHRVLICKNCKKEKNI